MKTLSLTLILCTFFFCFAEAQLHQVISIEQSENHFEFQIQIQNQNQDQALFELAPEALFQTWHGINSPQRVNKKWQFFVPALSNVEVKYLIPIQKQSAYFIPADLNWTPQISPQAFAMAAQTYEVLQAHVLPSFQFIHSATGKNQDSFDFVLCQCVQYQNTDGRLHVYLQKKEDELAKTLLSYLEKYLKHFESKIGPYPYNQFSIVESPDEIGYAFPKMTWIGTQLLHFPFILKTSLPHELLHSWWGNGVFVDYTKGNWCEGLTSFGSDYEFLSPDEKKLYRLKAITSYLDYVHQGNDLPLSKFQSRGEDRALQAIGYDKAMMVFSMAQEITGANLMNESLQTFYQKFQNQSASYQDFIQILQEKSSIDLRSFQNFWIDSTGFISQNFLKASFDTKTKTLIVKEVGAELQKIPNFKINLLLQLSNGTQHPIQLQVKKDGTGLEKESFQISEVPLAYALDPDFFLFRELNENEKPLTFSRAFSAQNIQISSSRSDFHLAAKEAFPNILFQDVAGTPDFNLQQEFFITSEMVSQFPDVLSELHQRHIEISKDHFFIEGKEFSSETYSLLLAIKVKNSHVFIFSLAPLQTQVRLLQRWQHYGAKNHLVLSTAKAEVQGIWVDPYFQKIELE